MFKKLISFETMHNLSKMLSYFLFIFSGVWLLSACSGNTAEEVSTNTRIDSLLIDDVWSGHPVGFDILTAPPHQFVAYYDSTRAMIVAQRKLGERSWQKKALPETIGWDSHNYIAMALDSKGPFSVREPASLVNPFESLYRATGVPSTNAYAPTEAGAGKGKQNFFSSLYKK